MNKLPIYTICLICMIISLSLAKDVPTLADNFAKVTIKYVISK